MRALTPWTGLPALRDLDKLFERFLEPAWGEAMPFGEWTPRLDVAETKDAVVVKAEIPGVDQQDIRVKLQDGVLTIEGEKRQEKEDKDEKRHRVERAYGAFMRAIQLPAAVEGEKVTAAFKDGLLTVTLPKAPGARGTTIPVKGA
jgi:HSP20 family protein